MLPWWFWVLLWLVLILATLLLVVLAGVWLFRRFMKVLDDLGTATTQFGEQLAAEGTVVEYAPRTRRYPSGTKATHGDPKKIRKKLEKGKAERIEARRERRVARRREREQAQNMNDLGLFDVDFK
ncbi:hypothetical protein GCM10027417_09180 [Glutamicibacter endophyticus]